MATTPKTETDIYVVAKGRSLTHSDDAKKPPQHFGPGDEIELPVEDGQRLQALGFLVGEDGTQAIRTDGPAVIQGEEIKEG